MILKCIEVCREQVKLSEGALALAQGSKASVAGLPGLDGPAQRTYLMMKVSEVLRKNIDACFLTIHH